MGMYYNRQTGGMDLDPSAAARQLGSAPIINPSRGAGGGYRYKGDSYKKYGDWKQQPPTPRPWSPSSNPNRRSPLGRPIGPPPGEYTQPRPQPDPRQQPYKPMPNMDIGGSRGNMENLRPGPSNPREYFDAHGNFVPGGGQTGQITGQYRPKEKQKYEDWKNAQQPGFRSPPRTPTPRRRPKGGYWAGLNKPVKLPPTPRRRPKTDKKKPTKTGGGYRYKGKTYKKYGDIPTARKVAMRGKRKRPISSPKRKTATKKTERKLKRLITRETSRVSKRRPTRSEVNTFWRKRK